ncbi:sulfite exporter TauE/SafE family protein [Aeromicrobium alkaliterrae]|uniref:Probable membrane transporter protein n=1 Tax=Aeromicrobium alkaliterrae TaxID=302168 RepID=A0ABN2JFI6_9ACTN
MSEALLVLAGIGAGLCGSVAGLASLVSYPALLAFGLPPLVANVTNTTAMVGTAAGAIGGSQPELKGQGRRVGVLVVQTFLGGLLGAALLLSMPAEAFEAVVPWLVALGSVLLLARDRIRAWAVRRAERREGVPGPRWTGPLLMVLVGVYGGYFGAGVGIIALAILAVRHSEPLAITNAVKNVATGVSNLAAVCVFVVVADVDWSAALLLGAGAVVGAAAGPWVVRRVPEKPFRIAVAIAGLGLAVRLAL